MVWTGRVLTGLFTVFLLAASIFPKLTGMKVAADTLSSLGWKVDYVLVIGLMEFTFIALYLYPPTAVLGAVLMTGLLGGAMATPGAGRKPVIQPRTILNLFGSFHVGGLWLRDPGLRAMFPWRKNEA